MFCYTTIKGGGNMEEKLISKKELLDKTGISYGQLYRWKRKSIIPEEWFIKKSSYTGQETYFPEDKILERIEKIKDMKDDLSLEALADMFSPTPSEVKISKEDLIDKGILSQRSLEIYENLTGPLVVLDFENILKPYILDQLLKTGEITLEEGKNLLLLLINEEEKLKDIKPTILLLRKLGISIWLIGEFNEKIWIDQEGKIVLRRPLMRYIEELKLKLEERG